MLSVLKINITRVAESFRQSCGWELNLAERHYKRELELVANERIILQYKASSIKWCESWPVQSYGKFLGKKSTMEHVTKCRNSHSRLLPLRIPGYTQLQWAQANSSARAHQPAPTLNRKHREPANHPFTRIHLDF